MKYKKTATSLLLFLFLVSMISGSAQAKPEVDPLVSLHLIAPTSNPVRMQYAQLMQDEFPKIGIYAEMDLISWDALGPRATADVVGPYDEGGYDICFFGMSLSTVSPSISMLVVYHSDGLPPTGFNAMYWAKSIVGTQYMNQRADESDALIEKAKEQTNITLARQALLDWQKIWYDIMPNVIIYNLYEVHAISTGLYGYDPTGYPYDSIEDQWIVDAEFPGTKVGNGSMVFAQSTGGLEYNTHIATDVYDQYTAGPPTDALCGLTPSKEVVLPEGTDWETWMTANYGTTDALVPYARCAKSLGTWDAALTNYTLELKDDVYWHDGHELDAWDVSFTFRWILTPLIGSPDYSSDKAALGTDGTAKLNGNYSVIPKKNAAGEYKIVEFRIPAPFGPFERALLTETLLPEHILGDPTTHALTGWTDAAYVASGYNISEYANDPDLWLVAPEDAADHSTNTANTADEGNYPGPIGLGSMVFYSRDPATANVELRKFKDIKWDTGLDDWVAAPGISHWNIGKLGKMPDVGRAIVSSVDSGLAEMKAGDVHYLDPQFSMGTILRELQAHPNIQALVSVSSGWQAIYFNPQFKASTSLGAEDRILNRKGVRHAVSHIVPRENIINYLLDGLGNPGHTPLPLASFAVMPTDDMLAFKKTVTATDGSKPEAGATTAFDEYSIPMALEWMATEGYDMTPWGGRDGSAVEPTETTTPTATKTKTKTKTKTEEEPPAAPGFELFMALAVFGVILAIRKKKK
jgi:ABC-type transport system substrate-binding protein